MAKVLLYTSPGCPDCAAVKQYLQTRGIAYEERDVTASGVAEEAKSHYGVRVARDHRDRRQRAVWHLCRPEIATRCCP